MIIGIAGDLCSGKRELASWLESKHEFHPIKLTSDTSGSVHVDEDLASRVASSDIHGDNVKQMTCIQFMEDFVMSDNMWQTTNWVVYPVQTVEQLKHLRKRPFFQLIGIEAPFMTRFRRWESLHNDLDMTKFAEACDQKRGQEWVSLSRHLPDTVVDNAGDSLSEWHSMLDSIMPSLVSEARIRPVWDDYFMLLSDLAARRSNCMKRQVGCLLVRRNRVIATGYNGTPRGVLNCNQGGCPRCNLGVAKCGQGLSECFCLHAEENAILEAGRDRIDNADGPCTLYCNTCPCLSCAKKIVQSGVKEVVYRLDYGMDETTASLFKQASLTLRQHQPTFTLHLSAIK